MQTDPIGYEDQMNLYAYVHNDPLNYTDPTGKAGMAACFIPGPMQACMAVAAKTGAAVATGAKWTAGIFTGLWAGNKANELLNESSDDRPATRPSPENPSWLGDDPAQAPSGTEWKGAPGSTPGDGRGNYHDPSTGESYRPDLDHPDPIGPHWDYHGPEGEKGRFYPDGTYEPK